MKYRSSLLLPSEDLGPAGTKTINLDTDKIISQIELTFKTTKASQGQSAGSPANIPKIELVDGSNVLHSLSGYQNQALAYYSRPGRIMDHGQHISTLSEVDTYAIDFGRHLWDPLLAFDPTRYKNPQLKITWDEDVSDTSATANALEVWLHQFDGISPQPMGFLSAKEHHAYTAGAANSYESILLPEDRPLRQLLVRAFYQGYEPWYNIGEARMDENTLDKVVFEYSDLEMYYRRMKATWPMIVQQIALVGSTGQLTYYLPATDYYASHLIAGQSAQVTGWATSPSSRGGKLVLDVSGNDNVSGLFFGYLPWHCFQFPLGVKDDIESWYDPVGKRPRLRLRASTGGTNVAASVVTEELVRY
jgi:hypothetical protein